MPNYYTYLISSLPLLRYGEKSPISFDRLLYLCRGIIPEEDIVLIEMIKSFEIYDYNSGQETLKRWRGFEIALRNELVKIRAGRRHIDPLPYLRATEESGMSLNHIAINAHRAGSPLESERVLDQARWQVLDELSIGHYFDIDLLITYACKLKILEKWDVMKSADNAAIVEKVLT